MMVVMITRIVVVIMIIDDNDVDNDAVLTAIASPTRTNWHRKRISV